VVAVAVDTPPILVAQPVAIVDRRVAFSGPGVRDTVSDVRSPLIKEYGVSARIMIEKRVDRGRRQYLRSSTLSPRPLLLDAGKTLSSTSPLRFTTTIGRRLSPRSLRSLRSGDADRRAAWDAIAGAVEPVEPFKVTSTPDGNFRLPPCFASLVLPERISHNCLSNTVLSVSSTAR
jgi:hypothetical protein